MFRGERDYAGVNSKDILLLHHLRNNSRENITTIAERMSSPVTTIYDRLRTTEERYVKRHTTLLDYPKLGLLSRMYLSMKIPRPQREKFEGFISGNPQVNTAHQTDFDGSYLIELVSKDDRHANDFITSIENDFRASRLQIFSVIKELSHEALLTKPEHASGFGVEIDAHKI